MKKRVFLLLLCLTLIVCMFASCGNGEEPTGDATNPPSGEKGHVHTYSETLSKDAEGHWYEATCDCEDVEAAKADHVDANNDGACDICTYTNHTHTYDTENWTVDCTNHWHAASCGHIVAGSDVAAHADANEDGKCDVCNYVIEDIHVHVFDDEWTSDATNHWHAALCEHKAEVADKAGHNVDGLGKCTVCGAKVKEINEANIAEVLAAASANFNNVKRGNVDYKYFMDGVQWTPHKVLYVLGPNSTFRQRTDGAGDNAEYEMQWLENVGTDEEGNPEIFAVKSTNGVDIEAIDASVALLNGYYYSGSTLADGNSLEEFITNLYALTQANDINAVILGETPANGDYGYASNVVITNDAENNTYEMTFNYLNVAVASQSDDSITVIAAYYDVAVEFTYSDNFVIIDANIVIKCYQDGQNVAGENDFVYDRTTGSVTLTDTADTDEYHFHTVQVEGERNYNTIYPKSSFLPTDFDLFTDAACTDEVEETETVYYLGHTKLYLGNLFPVTASLDYLNSADMTAVITDANGNDSGWYVTTPSSLVPYIGFTPRATGSYVLTVTYGDIVKTVELEVVIPDATGVNAYVFETNQYMFGPVTEVTESTIRQTVAIDVEEELNFVVKVDPAGAPQGFTYSTGNDYTIREVKVTDCVIFGDSYGQDLETGEYTYADVLQFISYVDGTYTIEFTSEDGKATGELIIVVGNGGENAPTEQTFNFVTPAQWGKTAEQVFTAAQAGTYVINAEGLHSSTWLQYYQVSDDTWPHIEANLPYEIELDQGEELILRLFGRDNAATDIPVTVTVALSEGGSTGGDTGDDDEADVLVGSGTDSDPYVITELGDYTCTFPGGWDLVWYTYTTTEGGYLTVSSTFETPWLKIGTDINTAISNEDGWGEDGPILAESVTEYYPANSTVYIGVADYNEAEADIPFSVLFEAVESDPIDNVVGSWTATETTLWGGSVNYTLVVNADGTGIMSYDTGWGVTVCDITYVLVDGEDVLVGYAGDWEAGNLAFTYIEGTFTCVETLYNGTVEFTAVDGVVGSGTGSSDDPYVISSLGNLTCEFPGGYDIVMYSYTTTAGGYVTITSPFATPWLQIGTDLYYMNSNEGSLNTMSVYIPANTTVYMGVGDWDEAVIDVPFTVSFVEVVSDPIDDLVGSWQGTAESGWATIEYDMTINEDGTGTLTYVAYSETVCNITYIVVDGDKVMIGYAGDWDSGVLDCTLADGVLNCEAGIWDLPVTLTPVENDEQGGSTSGETPLTIGNNNIEGADVTYGYTAEADGTLVLTIGPSIGATAANVTYSVNGGEAVTLVVNTPAELTLSEGDTVVVTCVANGAYATLQTSWTAVGGAEEEESTGSGTEADPYVLTTMPTELTFESDTSNKVYYIFTADQTGTATFTYSTENDSWYGITELDANGGNTSNSISGYQTTSFTFDVAEGTSYSLWLGTWMNSGEVTVTITVV